MDSYAVPPIYAAFIWWFSTGAVLLLVGRPGSFDGLRVVLAATLLIGSLSGLALTASDTSVGAAYTAFSCTILVWGAQEITFLSGLITGPRPLPCPPGARGLRRLSSALQAILYHELALLACGATVFALTWTGPNQIGIWTFCALWVLRQSAKINLFLGVPVTNDALMPDAVKFLKTYFARRPVSAFYPVSVTLAIAALVVMVQRIVDVATTPFDVVGLTLVSTLFALGIVEHWFMLLPTPTLVLWGWGMRSGFPPENTTMEQGPGVKSITTRPLHCATAQTSDRPSNLPDPPGLASHASVSAARNDKAPSKSPGALAKQRLDDEFRQRFLEQRAKSETRSGRETNGVEQIVTVNGRVS